MKRWTRRPKVYMVLTMGFYLFSLLTFTTMGLDVTLDTKGDAALPLKVQHKPAFSVVFQFQHAPLVKKPNIPHIYASHPVTPDNLKTYAGVTTGELNINETGKWRFRAQCNFPGAPWSEWRVFIVDTLTKIPSIEKK